MPRDSLAMIVAIAGFLAATACGSTRAAKPAPESPERVAGGTEGRPAESPPAEVAELKNTLRWKTASEVDNFGFDVYRATSEEGPFERLTAEPIAGAVTTDEPQSYVFEDDTIEAGRVYWYYVESISMGGVREKFTPVFAAKAKGGPTPEPNESPVPD